MWTPRQRADDATLRAGRDAAARSPRCASPGTSARQATVEGIGSLVYHLARPTPCMSPRPHEDPVDVPRAVSLADPALARARGRRAAPQSRGPDHLREDHRRLRVLEGVAHGAGARVGRAATAR